VQGFPAETGHFQSPSFMSGATVELVCASVQRGPQKSTLRCGFVYNCVENVHFKAVFSLSSPNTCIEQIIPWW